MIKNIKNIPKSYIYKIIRKGEVRANKKRCKACQKLKLEDQVRIPPAAAEALSQKEPVKIANINKIKNLSSRILYEDDHFLILNKPSRMAVHGGSGLDFGIIESIRTLKPDQKFLELGHRLDRETSGCLVLCKKRSALKQFQEQLRERKVKKEYTALVQGFWPKEINTIEKKLLKKTIGNDEKIVIVHHDGKPSKTNFQIQTKYKKQNRTLIKAFPVSGRTHQIRVHCLSQGCPIIGDAKYNREYQKKTKQERLFLHSTSISFFHSAMQKNITVKSDLDLELKNFLLKMD